MGGTPYPPLYKNAPITLRGARTKQRYSALNDLHPPALIHFLNHLRNLSY